MDGCEVCTFLDRYLVRVCKSDLRAEHHQAGDEQHLDDFLHITISPCTIYCESSRIVILILHCLAEIRKEKSTEPPSDWSAAGSLSSDEAAYAVSRRGLSISGALAACVKNAFFCRPNPLPGSVVQAERVSLHGKDVFYGKNMRSAAGHAQRWAALSCGQATSSALSIPQSG